MAFVQFQFRRGTAAEWASANPILADGEPGIETDTDRHKIGDGVTPWNSISYGGFRGLSGYSGFIGASGLSGYSSPGTSGFSGFSAASPGPSGYSGYSGRSGYSGFSGMGESGFSGFSGTGNSGYSGYSSNVLGLSGFSGYSGVGLSGYSGFSGSGLSGFSGYSGQSGYSGYSGFSGQSGFSGFSGYSGFSGFSGFSGISGYSAFSGFSGKSGYSGYSAYSGYSGPQLLTFSTQTDTAYTLVLGDANTGVNMSSATGRVLTVPTNAAVAFPIGTQIPIEQGGAGVITITPAGGVTVNGAAATSGQYSVVTLIKQGTDTWLAAMGISGYSGYSGYSGASGISGYSGFSGISGYSGFSGISGYSGFSGKSGYSGFSGLSGYSGFSSLSGFSGYSGVSGYSGFSGTSVLYAVAAGQAFTSTTLADVTGLTFSLVAGTYIFEAWLYGQITSGTAGVQMGINFTGTFTSADYLTQGVATGTTMAQSTRGTTNNAATGTFMTAALSEGYVGISGQIITGGAGTFSIRALKVTSQTFTIRAGSWARVVKVA